MEAILCSIEEQPSVLTEDETDAVSGGVLVKEALDTTKNFLEDAGIVVANAVTGGSVAAVYSTVRASRALGLL